MSKWVQKEILVAESIPRQRASVIGKLLEICDVCFIIYVASYAHALIVICVLTIMQQLKELQNYNGIMEIVSGLNTSSIFRLKQSWGVCFTA